MRNKVWCLPKFQEPSKTLPAIIPLELINNKNNGNDNEKMNNAD